MSVGVTTAKRWAKGLGLPVRKVGGVKSRVIADTAEIDQWVRGRRLKHGVYVVAPGAN